MEEIHNAWKVCLSIHDLTRRSTLPRNIRSADLCLSIHDLTRRSTTCLYTIAGTVAPFNSRPHKEVDKKRECGCVYYQSFNSRPHKEVDCSRADTYNQDFPFQFTTSQGGRLRKDNSQFRLQSFNSRPHKEVDSPLALT